MLAAQKDVKLVLVDLHGYRHSYGAISAALACKQVLPRARVAFGGSSALHIAAETLRSFPEVDFVIRGDAEEPLLSLVRRVCSSASVPLSSNPNLTYRVKTRRPFATHCGWQGAFGTATRPIYSRW
jgi:anaerobic magnesium-protoporphyrin IX monomethyl ester cyclase